MPKRTPIRVLKDLDDTMHLLTGKRIKDVLPRAIEAFGEDLVNTIIHPKKDSIPPDSPYAVLEVRPDASDLVVNAVYRVKARLLHPDNKETGDAEKFMRITEAYEAIKKARKVEDGR